METALHELIKERGISAAHLAETLGVHKSQITRWNVRRVPAERVLSVAEITGIAPHILRPDVFPAPETKAPSAKKGGK